MAAHSARVFRRRSEGIVLIVAMLLPTLATYGYFVLLAGTPWMQPVYAGCKVVQFALPLVWCGLVLRESLRIPMFQRRGLGLGFGSGLAIAGSILAVYYALPRDGTLYENLQRQVAVKIEEIGASSPALFIGMAAFIAVVHSLFEEYYWRWFVFGRLRLGIGWPAAMVVAGLAFAMHHVIVIDVYLQGEQRLTVLPIFALAVAAGGMLWAWLYQRTGGLAAAWLSHFLVDAALMAVGFDLWQRGLS